MAIVLDEVNSGLAEYDGMLLVFTWAVAIPSPIVWRAKFSPLDAASLEAPDDFAQVVGVYGETGLSATTDKTGTFRARFLASSPTVFQLETARLALKLGAAKGGPFSWPPLAITDLNAPGRGAVSTRAMVTGPPRGVDFRQTSPVLEYTFVLDEVESFWAPLLPIG